MAVYNLNPGETGAQDKVLAANVADTVNFPKPVRFVKVETDGSTAVFVTTDGSVPTVDGAHTRRIAPTPLAYSGAALHQKSEEWFELNGTQLRLIAGGAVTYSVEQADDIGA